LVREDDFVRDDDVGDVRGDLGGTGKTMDWMKLVLLVALMVVGVVTGVEAGDPERQDMQGARGKERRGQRWSIASLMLMLMDELDDAFVFVVAFNVVVVDWCKSYDRSRCVTDIAAKSTSFDMPMVMM
jgi:hypothetical protein